MRDLTDSTLDPWRLPYPGALRRRMGDPTACAFLIPSPIDGAGMQVLASSAPGHGWDHVSVSRQRRTPNWPEMEHVRKLFALPDETWVQFHVPAREHVNLHPNCLHLWHWTAGEFPRPDDPDVVDAFNAAIAAARTRQDGRDDAGRPFTAARP